MFPLDCLRVYRPVTDADPSSPYAMALSSSWSRMGGSPRDERLGDVFGEGSRRPAAKSAATLSDLAMTASKSSLCGITPAMEWESWRLPNIETNPLEGGTPSTLAVKM
jgi:hypothetical protein